MSIKYSRAWAIADANGVFTGSTTRSHIWSNIQSSVQGSVLDTMSSKQIAALICAANKSYHNGKADAQKELEQAAA